MNHLTNYHFVNGKAYTEDNMLVYNVCAHNIPAETTKAAISEYFKTFGDFVSVEIPNEASQQFSKLCVINYSDSLSAAKVLQKSKHSIDKKRIWVTACDSWHQPDAQPQSATAETETESTTNVALIFNLNDDCLDAIFKQLKMKDQINLARCCRRLRDVFVMRAKVEYKNLDLGELEFLTLWQIREFLKMAGSQMEKLTGNKMQKHFKRVVEFLGTYCINVKCIRISCTRLGNNMSKLLSNIHMVEELHLKLTTLKDDDIAVLKKLKKLKILALEGNYDITGKHIKDLTTVESLSLKDCTGIIPFIFVRICEELKDLKCLNIQCSPHLLTFGSEVVKYCHNVQTIKLSGEYGDAKSIASLPSLKHVYLYSFDRLSSKILVELANHRAEHLETLDICGYNCINNKKSSLIGKLKNLKYLMCPNNAFLDDKCLYNISQLPNLELLNIKNCKGFSNKGLLLLINQCSKLRTLNVSECKQLKVKFVTVLLKLLKALKQEGEEELPLKIIAYNSGISPNVINTTEFKSATDLLTISFEQETDSIYCDNASDSDAYDDSDDYMYDSDEEYEDEYEDEDEDEDMY